ncbi:hypothetical protein [Fusobacterium sp. IOR10]|uniref:hypothetical protein n=1 Tax=Fusobacterium sp. IOR10 TaxID=2665157 RepID=UPI0013D6C6C5|nr:hypothetical protein [Fusobacterium sp. IOR10]
MENHINSSIIKRLSKMFVSVILLLFFSLNIFAAGEVVNLERETETVHYENGDYIEYILELENKTSTVQENLQLTDTLFNSSGLEDLSVEVLESRGDGTSINIPSSPSEGNLIISGITLGHTNEVLTDEVITTAEEKGYIKLKIKGKVKDNFSENIVSNGELSRASDNILEVTVDSTLSRVVYDYSATLESVESTYAPGSLVTY